MIRLITFPRVLGVGLVLLVILFAIGWSTRDDPSDRPYLKITGSGFVFNYRLAEATYGFIAYLDKPAPNHSLIEVEIENPSGGDPILLEQELSPRSRTYTFQTPPLSGIEKSKPYEVHVRLIRHGDNAVLHDEVFTAASLVSSAKLPEKPLVIGPGYDRNPAL